MKPRVLIRPVAASDQRAFVAASRASASLHGAWVTAPRTASAFHRYLRRFDGQTHVALVVCPAATGELAGAIHITNVVYGPFCSGYLGFYAFAGHARQGLMTQGLLAAVRYAFGTMKLHRLEANIQPANVPSLALVRRCGFHQEGFSPAYLKIAGRWRDHERWAIVRGR